MITRIFLFLLLALNTNTAFAATYWLSCSAHGSGDGSSKANAMAISAANYTTLETSAAATDTIEISNQDGDCTFTGTITVAKSGSLATGTTFTVNTSTDVFTSTAHGLSNGDGVKLSTSGALPTVNAMTADGLETVTPSVNPNLSTLDTYIVSDVTADTFKLRTYDGGTVLNLLTAGSGTHTVQKINYFTVLGEGSTRAAAPLLTGSREIPEEFGSSSGNFDTGNTLFILSNAVSYFKIQNLRVNRVQYFLNAYFYQNNHIYIKDVLINHVREAIKIKGLNSCVGYGQVDCPTASYGWIIDNVDADWMTKGLVRMEQGFQHSTIVNSDEDTRYLFGDFPEAFHYAQQTATTSIDFIYFSGLAGSCSIGDTITGGTSAAHFVITGIYNNPIVATSGEFIYSSPTGTFTIGETLSNGSGCTATAVTATNVSGNSPTHNIRTINCTGRRNGEPNGTTYDNGDTFAAEAPAQGLYFENDYAFDNFDGGWDLKGGPHQLRGTISFRNKRNYRFWGTVAMDNVISGWGKQGYLSQYADGDGAPIWTSGIVTVNKATFVNGFSAFILDNQFLTTLDYTGGTGSVPIVGETITDQTNGNTAQVAGYTGNATSGTLYIQNLAFTFVLSHVITGNKSTFSATTASDGTTGINGNLTVNDSIMAEDSSHTSQIWVPAYSTGSSGTPVYTPANLDIYVYGISGTDPQFPNIGNKSWDVQGIDWSDPFLGPKYINEQKPLVMQTNDYNSALYTTTKGYYNVVTQENKHNVKIGGVNVGQ